MYFIGFDPGKDKCGIALIQIPQINDSQVEEIKPRAIHSKLIPNYEIPAYEILFQEVVAANASLAILEHLAQEYPMSQLILGNQTLSKSWHKRIRQRIPDLMISMVDEHSSSQQARQRYWDIYPARGCQRLLPKGMRTPPRPIDDIVALILLERYLLANR
ncbi:MAG: resolvase [Pseudanabaena sp. ELA607]